MSATVAVQGSGPQEVRVPLVPGDGLLSEALVQLKKEVGDLLTQHVSAAMGQAAALDDPDPEKEAMEREAEEED